MHVLLELETGKRFVGTNDRGLKAYFDTGVGGGGNDSAPNPMEMVLEAAAACSALDIVDIIRKKRKQIDKFFVDVTAERASEHPKVFTKIHLKFDLISPDATEKDLHHAVELSQKTYCSVSIMLARSGCEITWEAKVSQN